MNKELIKIIMQLVSEIKSKIKFVDSYKLADSLGYTEEKMVGYITTPVYNVSIYLEMLEYINMLMEGVNNGN